MIRQIISPSPRRNSHKVVLCAQEKLELFDSRYNLHDWFDQNAAKIKVGKKKQTGLAVLPDGRKVFVKRYQIKDIKQIIGLLITNKDKASHCYNISRQLIASNIPVPEPLAVITDKSGYTRLFYYICEALSGYVTLRKICKNNTLKSHHFADLMVHISKIIAAMHKSGIVHGDLKWPNIMVNPGFSFKVAFIDLDNTRSINFPDDKQYALDLSRFAVDMAENRPGPSLFSAFISAYSQSTGIDIDELIKAMTPFYQKISRKHKKKYGHEVVSLRALAEM